METVTLANHKIGPGQPCLVIAEAGVNHNGDVDLARRLVDAAADAGAEAVKFQTFVADQLVSSEADKASYQRDCESDRESQRHMLRRLQLSPDEFREIKLHCDRRGILFLSSPFDRASVDVLVSLGVLAIKIGSGDLTNHPLLTYAAAKSKLVILSTGMSDIDEVSEAVDVIRNAGCKKLVLLHCVSCYPAEIDTCNLRAMKMLSDRFDVPAGFSDHTIGCEAALAAVALGACVIEKHLTLDKTMPGPDHKASCEPDEFKRLIEQIRAVERALGDGQKKPLACEEEIRQLARRSLVAAVDIAKGQIIDESVLTAQRPGSGISPVELPKVRGRQAARDLPAGTLIQWADLIWLM
jgi:N-acetylneuraminate synthase/N,N'-diacetyllegionaminate synthase